jgi:hypothetical protein
MNIILLSLLMASQITEVGLRDTRGESRKSGNSLRISFPAWVNAELKRLKFNNIIPPKSFTFKGLTEWSKGGIGQWFETEGGAVLFLVLQPGKAKNG